MLAIYRTSAIGTFTVGDKVIACCRCYSVGTGLKEYEMVVGRVIAVDYYNNNRPMVIKADGLNRFTDETMAVHYKKDREEDTENATALYKKMGNKKGVSISITGRTMYENNFNVQVM